VIDGGKKSGLGAEKEGRAERIDMGGRNLVLIYRSGKEERAPIKAKTGAANRGPASQL